MRLASAIVGLVVLASVAFAAPAAAPAEPVLPVYSGLSDFPTIKGPADPEEYSWRVELSPGRELRPIDEETAAVYFEDGTVQATIAAVDAHDASGAVVPTSLSVSPEDVITLTVHHRAGDPAKDGAAFVYPVSPGHGFEVGFSSVTVTMPPLEPPLAGPRVEPPVPVCLVPRLKGQSLKTSRERLQKAGCELGEVRGTRSKTARVLKQFPTSGTARAAGAEIAVKLAD